MIIPVRCFTCSKVIGDLWEAYQRKIKEKKSINKKEYTIDEITIKSDEDPLKYFDDNFHNDILNELGLHKMCCRRHMLGHTDIIDVI